MRIAIVLVIAAGCGSSTSTPAPPVVANTGPVAPPAAPGLPALYAGLFVDGASWTFPAEAERRHNDDGRVTADVIRGSVTCRISNVVVIRGGKRAKLDCVPAIPDFTLTNSPSDTYVGTADGLWQVWEGDFNNDIATLDPEQVLLTPEPKPGRRDIVNAERDFFQAIEVTPHAGGWCSTKRADGEWEGWMLCLRAGDGVIGGGGFYLGAGSEVLHFGETVRY